MFKLPLIAFAQPNLLANHNSMEKLPTGHATSAVEINTSSGDYEKTELQKQMQLRRQAHMAPHPIEKENNQQDDSSDSDDDSSSDDTSSKKKIQDLFTPSQDTRFSDEHYAYFEGVTPETHQYFYEKDSAPRGVYSGVQADCEKMCTADDKCKAYQWQSDSSDCYFYKSVPTKFQNETKNFQTYIRNPQAQEKDDDKSPQLDIVKSFLKDYQPCVTNGTTSIQKTIIEFIRTKIDKLPIQPAEAYLVLVLKRNSTILEGVYQMILKHAVALLLELYKNENLPVSVQNKMHIKNNDEIASTKITEKTQNYIWKKVSELESDDLTKLLIFLQEKKELIKGLQDLGQRTKAIKFEESDESLSSDGW